MIAVRELALQKDLLEIPQRRRHALHALAKLDEIILNELLRESGLQQPRLKVAHIPTIEAELGDVVTPEQPAQMISDKLVRDGLARRRLQKPAGAPEIIRHMIGG